MQFNPMMPLAAQIMDYTTNPHIEASYNPITSRDTIGQPIRDQVFERDTTGQPNLHSRVTLRDSMGHPSSTPVLDLGHKPTYAAANIPTRTLDLEKPMREGLRKAIGKSGLTLPIGQLDIRKAVRDAEERCSRNF